MPLLLIEVNVWNAESETYRLIIKDGDKTVRQTTVENGHGGIDFLRFPITGPLTLIAEKV